MASYQYVDVPVGETLHLRSYAETNTSNVITELPRGLGVEILSALSDWRKIRTDDGIDDLEGYVDSAYLTPLTLTVDRSQVYIPRYSTKAWKRSSHSGEYYLPVKRIQEDLYSIGYTSVGTADGYYGKNTENAVRQFQDDNDLTVDGIFGANSKTALWGKIDLKG